MTVDQTLTGNGETAERTTCETARILSVLWTASLQPEVELDTNSSGMAWYERCADKANGIGSFGVILRTGLGLSCPMHRKRYMLQSEFLKGMLTGKPVAGKPHDGF